jgi:hypothetical protein
MRLVRNLEEGKVRNVTQHDAKGGPHLPHHDKTATDGGRGTFGSVNWHCGGLGTNAYSEEKARDEEMGPRVGDTLPNAGEEGKQSADEDGAPTTEPVIERAGEPATDKGATELQESSE